MFERPKSGERAVLVGFDIGARGDPDELAEFKDLAVAAGAGCMPDIAACARMASSWLR